MSEDSSPLKFPVSMENRDSFPYMLMTAYKKDGGARTPYSIVLPIPSGGLTFKDSGDYSAIELGMAGGVIAGAVESGNGLKGLASNIGSQMKSLKTTEIAALAAQDTKFGEQAFFAKGVVANPNANTTFKSNTLRNFTFTWNMIAESESESEVIRKIHSRFRKFTYADSENDSANIILGYPPIWTVKFMNGGAENRYIPKIFSCYLVSVDCVINQDANTFHGDFAPFSVSLSLSFQETRALTRTDITNMENDQMGLRGIDENGNPQIVPPRKQLPLPNIFKKF